MDTFKTLKYMIVMLLVAAATACSSSRPVTEAEVKANREAAQLISERQFLVKSDRIIVDKHSFAGVSPTTNFILVDGDDATVQVSPRISGGPNGVGGFTVKGKVSGYEVKAKDNGEVTVKFNVLATVGSCSVFVNLSKYGNTATVNINNTLRGKNATLFGKVTTVDDDFHTGRAPF